MLHIIAIACLPESREETSEGIKDPKRYWDRMTGPENPDDTGEGEEP